MRTLLQLVPVFASCCIGCLLLAACDKPTVSVNVHGVNYSGETFSYDVADPVIPDKGAGGELIDPFGAGGTACCVILPSKWRLGIKLQVRTTHWLKKLPDGSLPEVKQVQVVDLPPYIDGKPGELWVLRGADGKVSVISSDFQPDHAKWPGKVKGWPVPSLEYQRDRWELYRRHEEGGVHLFQKLLDELEESPKTRAEEAWVYAKQFEPATTSGFSGPNDPRYLAQLKQEYEEGLETSRLRLKQVMEARP
jgi:hypothetical protein